MGKAFPTHPAVVLRSHYRQVRTLLAIALIAVAGLTTALVILATDDQRDITVRSATPVSAPGPAADTRYDGGPEEGSRGASPVQAPSIRYDGGPEEGSRGFGR